MLNCPGPENARTGNRSVVVRGIGAAPGIARGPAVVLANPLVVPPRDLPAGAVLVVPYTTPFYLDLILRASAIVSDQGGITCHAAIIARERGIPCVVGTKIGTSVLKNGAHIIVDGERGLVTEQSD